MGGFHCISLYSYSIQDRFTWEYSTRYQQHSYLSSAAFGHVSNMVNFPPNRLDDTGGGVNVRRNDRNFFTNGGITGAAGIMNKRLARDTLI